VTTQAVAWAMDQSVPGTAGRVLIALSNRADHTNGFVHFDAPTIAREACIGVPSLWRYLGALERNGFISKDDRKTQDGDKREYWLALDRDPSIPWAWSAHDIPDSGETESVSAPVDTPAPRGFDRASQDAARKLNQAQARQPGDAFPVIEGSKAFRAWSGYLRARGQIVPYVRKMIVNGKECRGFEMPSLFPPGGEESAA